MSRWCTELIRSGDKLGGYARRLLNEEATKAERIAFALAAAGVTTHPQYRFALPEESAALLATCRRLEASGWLLTVRIAERASGVVVFRVVDSDMQTVAAGVGDLSEGTALSATVTPNTLPALSGTLIVRQGNAYLEVVRGPHHWLTKAPPDGVVVEKCWFLCPHHYVSYSTESPSARRMMYRQLKAVVRIGLDMRLKDMAESRSSVYVEFQWSPTGGYRFFEISFSWVWTSSALRPAS